ncbi:MAG: roadblock/LC7 domain-containing protein [Pseudomonadota bacterium]
MEAKVIGFPDEKGGSSASFLSDVEAKELDRILADERVVGFALIGADGEELAVDGIWAEKSAAIFANVMRLADRIGEELGEKDVDPVVFAETANHEIAAVTLSKAKAVIVRDRSGPKKGLSHVR